MATGDKVTTTTRNNTMTSINNARAKWGLSKVSSNVSSGTKTTASDYNNLITWLTEAKSKSGATTGIETKINIGDLLKETKLTNLQSQANAIYNWCVCHGNCSGTCSGKCSGTCSSSCRSNNRCRSGKCINCDGGAGGNDSCSGH